MAAPALAGQRNMAKLRSLLHWLLGKQPTGADPVARALHGFRDEAADPLAQLRQLVSVLRPRSRRDNGADERFATMLALLEADPILAAASGAISCTSWPPAAC